MAKGNFLKGLNAVSNVLSSVTGSDDSNPLMNVAQEQINKSLDEHRKLVVIPELYAEGFPLPLDKAIELLNELGLKHQLVELSVKDASSNYRDCFDTQVIETLPAAKQKVKPGSNVLIKYITQDVINRSAELWKKEEHKRKLAEKEKIAKQAERKEAAVETTVSALNAVKTGIGKLTSFIKNKNGNENE